MFKNYIKVALRNLWRNRVYSLINIAGLAIGMTCCMLILLFVKDELSYDRFHKHSDRIFRIAMDVNMNDQKLNAPVSPVPFAEAMISDFPEVASAVRLRPSLRPLLVSRGESSFYETGLIYTDSSFFDVFSFKLLKGSPQKALASPYSVVLSESAARKYFGDEDPLNQFVFLNREREYQVTGIAADPPSNSHFSFDFLVSFNSIELSRRKSWLSNNVYTYIRLKPWADVDSVESRLVPFATCYSRMEFDTVLGTSMEKMLEKSHGGRYDLFLQPLTDIHLRSHLNWEIGQNGDIKYVYIFSVVALLILLIACINFMNLATARSARRAREVGIRKVLGAHRGMLIRQFLAESVLQALVAMLFTLMLIEIFLPTFNRMVGKEFALFQLESWFLYLGLLFVAFWVGIFAGSYPAFFLSSFRPAQVLKGKLLPNTRGSHFRKILVVAQFAVSLALIICMTIIFLQLDYLRNKELGFDKENMVVIPAHLPETVLRLDSIRTALSENPAILGLTSSSYLPGTNSPSSRLYRTSSQPDQEKFLMLSLEVDYDFVPTMGMHLASGRNFSRDIQGDSSAFLVNEAAVREFGWKSPLGMELGSISIASGGFLNGKIIGVVKDFHVLGFDEEIRPMVLSLLPQYVSYISVRVDPEKRVEAIAWLEAKWKEIEPEHPFEFSTLKQDFSKVYSAEEHMSEIFLYFTILAIFIACLGLFGLSSYTAEQRTHEIGIRKVLGASVLNIVLLLTKELSLLVLISNLIAWPLAWYFSATWLSSFAYHIEIQIWVFVVASLLALLIAWVTVSFQAVKAAIINPAIAIRGD